MKAASRIASWVPTVIAVCSLISIIGLFQLDTLVNGTLYAYNLQFSSDWAIPYWNIIRTVFATTWIVAIAAIGLQLYNAMRKTEKNSEEPEQKLASEEKHWSTYKLGDGSTIKVKLVLKSARRLGKFSPDGTPMYAVATDNIVQVVDAPEELRVKPSNCK